MQIKLINYNNIVITGSLLCLLISSSEAFILLEISLLLVRHYTTTPVHEQHHLSVVAWVQKRCAFGMMQNPAAWKTHLPCAAYRRRSAMPSHTSFCNWWFLFIDCWPKTLRGSHVWMLKTCRWAVCFSDNNSNHWQIVFWMKISQCCIERCTISWFVLVFHFETQTIQPFHSSFCVFNLSLHFLSVLCKDLPCSWKWVSSPDIGLLWMWMESGIMSTGSTIFIVAIDKKHRSQLTQTCGSFFSTLGFASLKQKWKWRLMLEVTSSGSAQRCCHGDIVFICFSPDCKTHWNFEFSQQFDCTLVQECLLKAGKWKLTFECLNQTLEHAMCNTTFACEIWKLHVSLPDLLNKKSFDTEHHFFGHWHQLLANQQNKTDWKQWQTENNCQSFLNKFLHAFLENKHIADPSKWCPHGSMMSSGHKFLICMQAQLETTKLFLFDSLCFDFSCQLL